ncbi:MAG: GxxExxY protein [Desulfuromonadales bacterium]|nr:GxxExxY protein [Desulfuromonadales bacterium]
MDDKLHADVTNAIICCFYSVYNKMGHGFLEKVYENALAYELKRRGLKVRQQCPVTVHYAGLVVGEYYCDLMVEDRVIVEIKAISQLRPEHEAQLLNYLRATEIEVGLLINFSVKPEVKRRRFFKK